MPRAKKNSDDTKPKRKYTKRTPVIATDEPTQEPKAEPKDEPTQEPKAEPKDEPTQEPTEDIQNSQQFIEELYNELIEENNDDLPQLSQEAIQQFIEYFMQADGLSPTAAPIVAPVESPIFGSIKEQYNPNKIDEWYTTLEFNEFIEKTKHYLQCYYAKCSIPPCVWFYDYPNFEQLDTAKVAFTTMVNHIYISRTDHRIKFHPAEWFVHYCKQSIKPVCDPMKPKVFTESGNTFLNLFAGYKWSTTIEQPAEHSEQLNKVLEHIKMVWCSGDTKQYMYLLLWLSNIAHSRKNTTMIFLNSQQGSGKNIITDWLRLSVFGSSVCHSTEEIDDLVGSFNGSQLVGKVFIVLEEVPRIDKEAWNKLQSKLKHLATSDEFAIKEKYKETYRTKNIGSYMIMSNHDAIRISADDRRFCQLDVSDCKIGQHEYFRELAACCNDSTGREFWAMLLSIDVNNFYEQSLPITESRSQTIADNLHPVARYIRDRFLTNNTAPVIYDGEFEQLYYDIAIAVGPQANLTKIKVSKELKKLGLTTYKKNNKVLIRIDPREILELFNKKHWFTELDVVHPSLL